MTYWHVRIHFHVGNHAVAEQKLCFCLLNCSVCCTLGSWMKAEAASLSCSFKKITMVCLPATYHHHQRPHHRLEYDWKILQGLIRLRHPNLQETTWSMPTLLIVHRYVSWGKTAVCNSHCSLFAESMGSLRCLQAPPCFLWSAYWGTVIIRKILQYE